MNNEKREKQKLVEKTIRLDESEDAVEKIFKLKDILDTPEITKKNTLNIRNPSCFPAGPFYLCYTKVAAAAADSEPSKVSTTLSSSFATIAATFESV